MSVDTKRYDPNQRRDWHGRWVSFGGSRLEIATRRGGPRMPKFLEAQGMTDDLAVSRIKQQFVQNRTATRDAEWYQDAHDQIAEWVLALNQGDVRHVDPQTFAGVVAVCSANEVWDAQPGVARNPALGRGKNPLRRPGARSFPNLKDAARAVRVWQRQPDRACADPKRYTESLGKHPGLMPGPLEKALHLLCGDGPDALMPSGQRVINGPKERSFYNNLCWPTKGDSVAVDRHAARIITDEPPSDSPGALKIRSSTNSYVWAANMYRRATAELNAEMGTALTPSMVQAAAWAQWRRDTEQAARERGKAWKPLLSWRAKGEPLQVESILDELDVEPTPTPAEGPPNTPAQQAAWDEIDREVDGIEAECADGPQPPEIKAVSEAWHTERRDAHGRWTRLGGGAPTPPALHEPRLTETDKPGPGHLSRIQRPGFGPTPLMLMVCTALPDMETYAAPALGRLLTPQAPWRMKDTDDSGVPWAADNGCYSAVDDAKFVEMIDRMVKEKVKNCLWVTAPDIPFDARATRKRFEQWQPYMAERGIPVALVAQEGLCDPDMLQWLDGQWDKLTGLFIGGHNAFKTGPCAAKLARMAHEHGKLVHVGRVNSMRRISTCRDVIGADSADGTGFSALKRINLKPALEYIASAPGGWVAPERPGDVPDRAPAHVPRSSGGQRSRPGGWSGAQSVAAWRGTERHKAVATVTYSDLADAVYAAVLDPLRALVMPEDGNGFKVGPATDEQLATFGDALVQMDPGAEAWLADGQLVGDVVSFPTVRVVLERAGKAVSEAWRTERRDRQGRWSHGAQTPSGATIPAPPGTTPIPKGHVRLFHRTYAPAEKLRREGLRMSAARGESYGEPNQIWASADPKFADQLAGDQHAVVEFHVPYNDPRWDIGAYEPGINYAYPGPHNSSPEAFAQNLARHGEHVTFRGDIKPSEIVAVHESWHQSYRYLMENYSAPGTDTSQFDWALKPGSGMDAGEQQAIRTWKRQMRGGKAVSEAWRTERRDPHTGEWVRMGGAPGHNSWVHGPSGMGRPYTAAQQATVSRLPQVNRLGDDSGKGGQPLPVFKLTSPDGKYRNHRVLSNGHLQIHVDEITPEGSHRHGYQTVDLEKYAVAQPAAGGAPIPRPRKGALSRTLQPPKSGKVRKIVQETVPVIDGLLNLPDLEPIPVKAIAGKNKRGATGYHTVGDEVKPEYLKISPDKYPHMTLAHETGHFIDTEVLGTEVARTKGPLAGTRRKMWGSLLAAGRAQTRAGRGPKDFDLQRAIGQQAHAAEWDAWWKAVNDSPEVDALGTASYYQYATHQYLLQPPELWARSFAQWVSTRGLNTALNDELDGLLDPAKIAANMEPVMTYRNFQEVKRPATTADVSTAQLNRQWQRDDFKPIGDAIDKLMGAYGIAA